MKKLFLFFATLCLSVGAMAYDATFENTGVGFGYYGYGSIVAIDLNGDGYQSILFFEDNTWQRTCYLKNDRGTLTKYTTEANVGITTLGLPYYNNPSLVAMDINHDGKQDLVVAPNVWTPVLDVYYSNGINNTMTKANNQPNLVGQRDYSYTDCLAAGDYDGDGWEDLFVVGQTTSGFCLSIYHNNNGVFDAPNQTLPGSRAGSIAVGDIDMDGNLDIFYTGYQDGEGGGYKARLYYGDGHGNWTIDPNNTGFHRTIKGDVAIIDFDNDGYPDLLEQGRDYIANNIWKNNGNRTFTKKDATATGLPNSDNLRISYGDFNLDGFMDIIAADDGLGNGVTAALFLNNGNFTFTRQNLSSYAYWGGVFAWDYDKDKKCDYLAWGHHDSESDWAAYLVHNTTIPAIALSEDVDNSAILAKWNGQTANVTLTRNMVADGDFHTLCLPFSLNASQIEAAFGGAGYVLKELTDAEMEDETLNLIFDNASAIEAGKPYLFKPASTINAPIAINGVTINSTLAPQTKADLVTFTGILNPTELTAGDKNTLILDAGNTLGWPSVTANMPGMRAYFAIHDGASSAAAARAYFDGKIPTGTENIQTVTNIQKVLDNGQVVIIYNGIRYNVMGQKIR